jgi:hypothetical protein
MNTQKMAGHILYAIGIIGGVEAVARTNVWGRELLIVVSVIAIVVIAIGAYLLEK